MGLMNIIFIFVENLSRCPHVFEMLFFLKCFLLKCQSLMKVNEGGENGRKALIYIFYEYNSINNNLLRKQNSFYSITR
jgi:hypothetical protein